MNLVKNMKNKLKEIISSPNAMRRWGDFVCNFTAVVLGIILTFVCSDLIEKHNTNSNVKKALKLVKKELQENRKQIVQVRRQLSLETAAANFFGKYKDNFEAAPDDSIRYYLNVPFRMYTLFCTNDALELLKTSALFQHIENEQLALQLIGAYGSIKTAETLHSYFYKMKGAMNDAIPIDMELLTELLRENARKLWSTVLSTKEGRGLVLQIPNILSERPYDSTLESIDAAIVAIEKYTR